MPAIVCILYGLTLFSCVMGMYYQRFKTNIIQRIGLALLGFWLVWRIRYVSKYLFASADDVMIALAMATLAVGSLTKMIAEKNAPDRLKN